VAAVGVVQRGLFDRGDRRGTAVEHVGGDVAVQSAVLMFIVIPVEELAAPSARMGLVGKARRIVGLRLDRLEVRL